jgi:hypothetical protein
MWKEAVVVEFKLLFRNFPGVLTKTTRNLSRDSRSPSQEVNAGPPEYETGVLTT